jgi:biotin carboxyl carrier protein
VTAWRKRAASLALALLALFAAPPLLAGPGAHGPDGEHLDGAPASATGLMRLPDGSVNVPKLAQRRMEIRTLMVAGGEHPVTVELNGRIGIDPNAGGRVQAPFAGRIEAGPQGLPVPGQRVRKGQVLLRLRPTASAADRASQESALADLRANHGAAERRLKRLEALEGSVPAKELEAARAELASIQGRMRALTRSLQGVEAIVAPATGVIASANVLAGQLVEARDVLYEVVDPSRLLVEASTPDATLAARIAGATLPAAPQAQLKLIGAGLALRDGALPISFRASGEALPLAVGQAVTILARLHTTVQGIALPAEAVVRNPSNQPVVWIKSGALRFIPQPVEARPLDGNTVVVTRGLGADNRVVVRGAALINQIR